MKYIATVNGRDLELDVDRAGEITVDGATSAVDLRRVDGVNLYSLLMEAQSHELFVERQADHYVVMLGGERYVVEVADARLKRLKAMSGQSHEERGAATVSAPMPGLVVKLLVAAGDEVVADQALLILEAMKMENEIRSPRAGTVRSVAVAPGATVNDGDQLVVIDAPE